VLHSRTFPARGTDLTRARFYARPSPFILDLYSAILVERMFRGRDFAVRIPAESITCLSLRVHDDKRGIVARMDNAISFGRFSLENRKTIFHDCFRYLNPIKHYRVFAFPAFQPTAGS